MKKLLVLLSTLLLAGCSSNDNPSASTTTTKGLKGKFVNEVELRVLHRKDISTEDRYLYTSSYPLNNITGFGCYETHNPGEEFRYYYNQTLTLQKDYSFHYVYEVVFGNPWNCPEMMSINVDIYGTYTYSYIKENEYVVSLSSPITGTETYYGCNFSVNELWWFGGGIAAKHATPDKQIDFALNKEVNKEEIDWYVRAREVRITTAIETDPVNTVYDDLFNSYFLDHVGQFCTY